MANQQQAITEVRQSLTKMAPEIQKVLPQHVTADRFERITMTALQRQPDLLGCERKSLFESVLQCASDGLVPDGREAVLTKFKDKVAYMPMIQGILKKVRQSGELSSITAEVVYDNDEFSYWVDESGVHFKHAPEFDAERGKMKLVYAVAKTRDGGVYFEVLSRSDVESIRKASRAGNAGPWKDWEAEMWRKSALRRLSKRLPMSTDLEQVVTRDDQFYPFDRTVEPAESVPAASESVSALNGGGDEPPPVDEQPGETVEAAAEGEGDDVF